MDNSLLGLVALDWLEVDSRSRMIISESRMVHWINERARTVLTQVSTVSIVKERICFRMKTDEARFDRFMIGLDDRLQSMAVPFNGDICHLLLRGRRLPRTRSVCLEIGVAGAEHGPSLSDFDQVFSLTSSEAKTAAALFQGHSVTDVASMHHVSVGTVRTHVRQIYAKLGTANREQFFRRLQPFYIA